MSDRKFFEILKSRKKAFKAAAASVTLMACAAAGLSCFPIGGAVALGSEEAAPLIASEPEYHVYRSVTGAEPAPVEETVIITKQYSDIHYEDVEGPKNVRYVESPYLKKDQQMVIKAGKGAVYSIEYATLQSGERIELDRELVSEAEEELVLKGTGANKLSANATTDFTPVSFDEETGIMEVIVGDQTLKVYGAIKCTATAYCACSLCCGPYASGRTSTGTQAKHGTVAVDPRTIPYGTKMYITSTDGSYVYGTSYAEDCGGAINGSRIDLFFETHSSALQFGRKSCIVYILAE